MSWILLIMGGLFEVGFASCLGKVETKGIESTYWMLGFLLSKYKYATAV
jgi:quaternary ammonium compound-resistance protein SugE